MRYVIGGAPSRPAAARISVAADGLGGSSPMNLRSAKTALCAGHPTCRAGQSDVVLGN